MVRRRIIMLLVVCFSIGALTGQTLSQMGVRPIGPVTGMSAEEVKKRLEEWRAEELQKDRERLDEFGKEGMVRAREGLLRVTEGQWKVIEPKYERVRALCHEARIKALGYGTQNRQTFRWAKRSEPRGEGKRPDEMTEGEKTVEELIELLEDKSSKDDQIRQKIDALQQVREKARKQLPEARQELREVVDSRQEAIFLLRGIVD